MKGIEEKDSKDAQVNVEPDKELNHVDKKISYEDKKEKQETKNKITLKKSTLAVNQATAGAGVAGLLGAAGLFLVSSVFFITESYFIAMLTVSFALLVYVSGLDLSKILLSSFTIFFSSKHLIPKAAYLQETIEALRESLKLKRDSRGEIISETISFESKIKLPNNPLVHEIQRAMADKKEFNYVEYITHSFYVECHELYDFSITSLDFVAHSMPLFGLIGTVVGLIAMFDSLGANVTVETLSPQLAIALKTTLYGAIFSSVYRVVGSRFEQRIRALDYDYQIISRALEVLIDNRCVIEMDES